MPVEQTEYAFEMATSAIRFGEGCTLEVGMDVQNLGVNKVLVLTDKTVAKLLPMKNTITSLERYGVKYEIFDKVRIEPKDYSYHVWKRLMTSRLTEAIEFARKSGADGFIAVGGGSVIDTAKISNLYVNHPEAEFLDFVNAPLGKGLPVKKKLSPLIAIPTTAGTGSETTGSVAP
jgi:hydroxyacid-oxoacid transhydrogenase